MGYISVDISPSYKRPQITGRIEGGIAVTVNPAEGGIRFLANSLRDIFVGLKTTNPSTISVDRATSRLSVDIGVMYSSIRDAECYLQVLDGYVLTVDGCFIKVIKG